MAGAKSRVFIQWSDEISRYTKELRQQIVEEFSRRHNGVYNPVVFLQEVRETGKEHPAWSWFQWDDDKAAQEHRLWQARSFAKDLRVKFEVEEISRGGAVTVKSVEVPMVLSPMKGRNDGGGYLLTDKNNPEHMAEHCKQAATALRAWMKRYKSALDHAGIPTSNFDLALRVLENPPAVATIPDLVPEHA